MTELALPSRAAKLIGSVPPADRHPGLQLDKLSPGGQQEQQGRQIDRVVECRGYEDLLGCLLARRDAVLDGHGALRLRGRTVGPLTLHLSRSGALESAGIALHPIYGFAWLPGTGIKGMTRAWAETVWVPGEADPAAAWRRIDTAFGTTRGSESSKGWRPNDATPLDAAAGRIVFHDAWPVSWPRLERDIVNSHHAGYYQGANDPGDWEYPTIVSFLAVAAGTEFEFALSDRAPAGDGLAELAMEWMRTALLHVGAGAKTAAGYGRIAPVEGDPPASPARLVRAEHGLQLVSPAFLAGANQTKGDCDLRPATLRGLLRWWWRTMHAHNLARDELAELETVVWGNAESGSAVALAVERDGTNPAPTEYRKNEVKQEHGLEPPAHGAKLTQGLFYASYGMDETNRGRRRSRWFRQAGDSWHLVLTARDGIWGEDRVPAVLMMEQAEAALWLLARFGGAGSKSRKGFGSFADVEVRTVRSIEDCVAAGQRLRGKCGFSSGGRTVTPALEGRIGPVEIETPWRDPWYVLDRIGHVYQAFAKSRSRDDERLALGLPRRVGQRPGHTLKAGKIDRHASPVHWSLARGSEGTLTVRLIAFPAPKLPNEEISRAVLTELADNAERDLKDEARREERRHPAPPPAKTRPAQTEMPETGARVRAVLLEEKTRKGKWKARSSDRKMIGDIINSDKVPGDRKPGDEVELIVRIAKTANGSFRWPEDVEERLEKADDRRRGGARR